MQSITVMAFRKRLKIRGYSDISISRVYEDGRYIDRYVITAFEPLAGSGVTTEMSELEMYYAMRF